jgi:hypothetical protein
VIIRAPIDKIRAPRTLGHLEPIDAKTCRLTGTTSNPWWYAEQLLTLHAPFRIIGGPEIRHTATELGKRLLEAATDPPPG